MKEAVKQFVMNLIEKKTKLPQDVDINDLNYIDAGYVDSIGIIKFVVDIETHFNIEITDSDIESSAFRTIGGVVSMIIEKTNNGKNE